MKKNAELAIVGGGPAGITAGLYAARSGVQAVIYEKGNFGGELAQIINIENYPGYTGDGKILAQKMREQAENAGVIFEYGECEGLETQRDGFLLKIDGEDVTAKTVLIAVGNEPRKLDIDVNIPVSYCSLCDAPLVKNKNVVVIGGGYSATQEAISLSKIAKSVTILARSQIKVVGNIRQRLENCQNIRIIENAKISKEEIEKFEHAFVFIGHLPATDFLPKEILRADGTIMTGASAKELEGSLDLLGLDGLERRSMHETLIPGLFAAGDVRFDAVRQVVTASGDGAAAAIEITDYLDKSNLTKNKA